MRKENHKDAPILHIKKRTAPWVSQPKEGHIRRRSYGYF